MDLQFSTLRVEVYPTLSPAFSTKRNLLLRDNYTSPHGFQLPTRTEVHPILMPPNGSRFVWKVEMESYNRPRFALKVGDNVG